MYVNLVHVKVLIQNQCTLNIVAILSKVAKNSYHARLLALSYQHTSDE